MQLLVLALVIGVFSHDSLIPADRALIGGAWMLLGVGLLPKLILGGLYAWVCRSAVCHLGGSRAGSWMQRLDRITWLYRLIILGLFVVDLWLGLLVATRGLLGGNVVIADELLVLAPSLALAAWGWWCYYPIDRRMREAALLQRMDQGMPVYPIWTRRQYVLSQFRHQMALLLVPLLLMMGWLELVQRVPVSPARAFLADPRPLLVIFGTGCVFLFAPFMIRHIWDTVPLPQGDMRRRLQGLCRFHGVGVRELLLWRTYGGMINAAVMGLAPPLRYILLTDALLESLPVLQIEAVMAHEIAHVRKRHMFWLMAAALTLASLFQLGWMMLLAQFGIGSGANRMDQLAEVLRFNLMLGPAQLDSVTAGFATAACWLLVFGWVSRRFERQADAFAVQHLSIQFAAEHGQAAQVMLGPAVETMAQALQQVADLNHIPTHRHSWRHGSIAGRQAYLRSLVGRPLHKVDVDRQVGWIKIAVGLGIAILAGFALFSAAV